jgi:hypothetical protein
MMNLTYNLSYGEKILCPDKMPVDLCLQSCQRYTELSCPTSRTAFLLITALLLFLMLLLYYSFDKGFERGQKWTITDTIRKNKKD